MPITNFKKVNTKGYYLVYDNIVETYEFGDYAYLRNYTPEDWDSFKQDVTSYAKEKNDAFNLGITNGETDGFTEEVMCEANDEFMLGGEDHPFLHIGVESRIILRKGVIGYYNLDYDITVTDGWDIVTLSKEGSVDALVEHVMKDIRNMAECYGLTFIWGLDEYESKKDDIRKALEDVVNKAAEECESICHDCAEDRLIPAGKFDSGEEYYEWELPF